MSYQQTTTTPTPHTIYNIQHIDCTVDSVLPSIPTVPNSMSESSTGTSLMALVGDSDISRWPPDLVPTLSASNEVVAVKIRGQSGATLEQVLPLLKTELEEASKKKILSLTVVFCAGENDIGQNIRLDETLISFRKLLDMLSSDSTIPGKHLMVLGPKFEPWLECDAACRKQYFKLSNAMERACRKHNFSGDCCKITFVDCLTMFCGDSAKQPGAVLGGKAIPEKKYFDHDLLHLSREGYQIWREVIEKCSG